MAKLQAPGVSPGNMLFLRSSPVGAKDPTESVAPMSGCECKPGRAQPSRKTVLRSKGPKSPGLRPGLHTVAAPRLQSDALRASFWTAMVYDRPYNSDASRLFFSMSAHS